MDITKDFLIGQLMDVTNNARHEGWNEALIFLLKRMDEKSCGRGPTLVMPENWMEAQFMIAQCVGDVCGYSVRSPSEFIAKDQLMCWATKQKLKAVKNLKDYYGMMSLKDAEDAVEAFWEAWGVGGDRWSRIRIIYGL